MNNVKYICPYCKTRTGHTDPRQVEICRIQSIENPTESEVLEYLWLKDLLEEEKANNLSSEESHS